MKILWGNFAVVCLQMASSRPSFTDLAEEAAAHTHYASIVSDFTAAGLRWCIVVCS